MWSICRTQHELKIHRTFALEADQPPVTHLTLQAHPVKRILHHLSPSESKTSTTGLHWSPASH
ncbi:predicted protein [Plenodomus lingam JN3]|uniref:Predicted protein n=1 Tax=Leptosphaeria maculans (strain JN3 / isolate v23.1.3 / race Av1-4-5-6-7-8) TaxID=985895 RepID=E4ZSY8_LEPMJ|nr:predicted protein [Plenodomus lingam JN3]CBX94576.1 predicted protein [Plenodomus lingam JN3]